MASLCNLDDISPKIQAWHRELLELQTDRQNGCWIWTKSLGWDGYGVTKVAGRSITVHRLAYLLFNGTIPDGMVLRHRCPSGDNRACVNPAHLILGTRAENNRDTASRKAARPTSLHRNHSVPDHLPHDAMASDAMIIKYALDHMPIQNIAARIGLPLSHVDHILTVSRAGEAFRELSRFERRFWSKTEKTDGCWKWTAMTVGGYGRIRIDDRLVGAHQASWRLHFGPVEEGLVVCHNCPGGDNPTCVNPSHLYLGTQRQNMQDRSRKQSRRAE